MKKPSPETEVIAVDLNDRRRRHVFFLLNHDQQCIVAAWIEPKADMKVASIVDGVTLYKLLSGLMEKK